jgi:Zn-dependent metalloprotease
MTEREDTVIRRRRTSLHGLLILLMTLALTISLPAAVGASPGGGAKQIDPALVTKLKEGARGSVKIRVSEATNFASFIAAGRNGDLLPGQKAAPQGKAKGFLKQFGGILGVANADTDLVQVRVTKDAVGGTHITYTQQYRGLSVFGGVLKAHLDAAGNLTSVNGTIVPAIGVATKPKLSANQASAKAIAEVKADPPGGVAPAGKLSAASNRLMVYRTGLIKGDPGTNELVYEVVVSNGSNVRDAVYVHAISGLIINRYTLIDDALYRVLYEISASTPPVWEEGDPFPGSLNSEQLNILNFTEDSYNFFVNAFGRVSYDGADAHMRSVNNDPTIACPNANWNGATTNYCNGVTSDDVVAHEWGHAYTEYTHNLIYQWQPGALNESYSDIWGETIDIINGAGTDDPGPVRAVGACSAFSGPRIVLINAPAVGDPSCTAGTAVFGPAISGSGITSDAVWVTDGVGATNDGCTALTNAAAVAGKIAFVDRGTCSFKTKTKVAQDAGAIGVVIGAVAAGQTAFGMADDPTIVTPITIPTLSIGTVDANQIRPAFGTTTVNLSMKQDPGPVTEDSYRWLMGEDSFAFQGAIRDMWNPNCLGDAGKVSDAQYHCAVTDNGGVHSNSGVPNHGYALLVDGGTYNGQTVTGLGLVKAAHIYWQAQSAYQTPTSKFPDHADALEASCNDLIGATLAGLSTDGPASSSEVITLADCVEVSDMIAAVELRTDPTQCNFQPILNGNTPKLCTQKNPSTHWTEDFEDGLAGWTLTNQGVYSGWPGTNWAANSSAPGGHAGTVAFGEDIDGGDCGAGAGDISGVMRLESPSIMIPASATLSPRLTFEHYVATEAGWDGGNIKLSINGGAYAVIPASAFQFNPYNATLQTVAAGNTNPLAGEPGFTGTDGGEVHGSWGVSQINLSAIGVAPGDSIKVRFDFGMDGCTGIDGWYVDNIKLQSCNTKKNPSAAALPSRFDA